MSDRHIVVVDVETNGLDFDRHVAVEVAWHNLDTDERGSFVPPHNVSNVLATAEVQALQINRYIDRLADAEQDREGKGASLLWEQLCNNTLAGCNPGFDARFIAAMYEHDYDLDAHGIDGPPSWHHRLADLSVYAAGVLGLALTELPGLSTVCELLHVEHLDPHTAAGDVDATVACFRELARLQHSRRHLLVPAAAGGRAAREVWWQHACGHLEQFNRGFVPEDGGCDACESGSPHRSDWQPVYVADRDDRDQLVLVKPGEVCHR